jgi:hypothetical protein
MSSGINEPGIVFMAIPREEADAILAAAALGSYLIRPSSQGSSVFSLSYKHAQTGRLGHMLLKRTPQGTWSTEGVANSFASLRSLLKRLPYGLRIDDDNMVASTGGNYAQISAAAAPGYGSVGDMSGGYGKVPKAGDDGYTRAPAASSTGEYAAISPLTAAAAAPDSGYARLQTTAFATQNLMPGTPDYGRVPNAAASAGAAEADPYGRVPMAANAGYARLNPTAPAASPSLTQRGGAGYGRVPVTDVPAGVLTTRRSSPAVGADSTAAAATAAAAASSTPGNNTAFVTGRRNLPVASGGAGSNTSSPSLARTPSGAMASPASPASVARSKQGANTPTPQPAMSARAQANYASVSVANSGTVNAPHQFAMQALQLMQGHETLAGHERFLRAQLGILAKAREKAATSTPVYTALVQLGHEMGAYVAEMRAIVKLDPVTIADALMRNNSFQQHYISIQLQMRDLKSLIELGDGFQNAIQSELGHRFWQTKIGRNNSIAWDPFFMLLQSTLGMNLSKVESFVRFMFDCNKDGKITTQSFNMFIHWFDYEGIRPPVTIKDFFLILIARAETVFFFEGFHGFCSREQAERVLANRPPTSFMIRLSDSSAGVFILSYIDSKLATRHRLLNQVDKQGFMVEHSTYNTLPDLLQAHHEVLSLPVPNSTSFSSHNDAIYGGGEGFYDTLASAASPPIKGGEPYYHAKIVLNRMWVQVRLELRETELVIMTSKSPLRRSFLLTEITECVACQAPSGALPCFRVVAAGQAHVFGCADPQEWVAAVQGAVAAEQRKAAPLASSASERSAEEKLANGIVTRRADLNEQLSDLQRAYFTNRRRPGELTPTDLTFVRCLNAALAKQHASGNKRAAAGKPPQLSFSKLDLDLQLNGQKCEVEVPVRDTVVIRNDGGAPIELRVDTVKRQSHTLKFVPNQMTLAPGQAEELHVTLLVHQTATVKELLHVSIGPNRGHSSIFFCLDVSSKIMESLVFEEIDFGPRLGAGAFGQVFQGAYRGREVAVKAVGFEPDFDQELNILRELRPCPTIVEYIGSCKRVPFQGFIVLEFMQLGSLDKYVHDKSFQLTLQFSMRVAYDVANGLAHLHRSKIMHPRHEAGQRARLVALAAGRRVRQARRLWPLAVARLGGVVSRRLCRGHAALHGARDAAREALLRAGERSPAADEPRLHAPARAARRDRCRARRAHRRAARVRQRAVCARLARRATGELRHAHRPPRV